MRIVQIALIFGLMILVSTGHHHHHEEEEKEDSKRPGLGPNCWHQCEHLCHSSYGSGPQMNKCLSYCPCSEYTKTCTKYCDELEGGEECYARHDCNGNIYIYIYIY